MLAIIGFFISRDITANAEDHKTLHSRITVQGTKHEKLCSRVDKIETTLPYTTKALDRNTEAIRKIGEDIQEIKVILVTTIKDRKDGNSKD